MEEYSITVRDLKIRYKSVQAYSIKEKPAEIKRVLTQRLLRLCAASVSM